jgi:uncharacterized protein (TIRG00374 family)
VNEPKSTSGSIGGIGRIAWPRILLSIILGAVAIYFISRNLEPGDIQNALNSADRWYIFVALIVVVATMLAKTGRWQLIFSPRNVRPSFSPLFWALSLGQFLNTILPIRLGEVARIYSLEQNAGTSKALTFSTLVIEKSLEMASLVLTMLLLLPIIVLPDFVAERSFPLALLSLAMLLVLFMLAFNNKRVVQLLRLIFAKLPSAIEARLIRFSTAGLEGLAALRDWRQISVLGMISAVIVALAILVPYLLFRAFNLPLGLSEAVLLNVAVSLGSVPPSTPGKVFIFEGIVVFMLRQFGSTDNAVILGFAIIFHLVVVIPQIIFGSLAATRGSLKWPAILGSSN